MGRDSERVLLTALDAVVRDHGWLVTDHPARLRAALSDVLGSDADEQRGALDAVVVSAEEGVPRELRSLGRAHAAEAVPELAARLAEWGLSSERAEWVVQAWVTLLPESTVPPVSPVADVVPSTTDVTVVTSTPPPVASSPVETAPVEAGPGADPEPTAEPEPPGDEAVAPDAAEDSLMEEDALADDEDPALPETAVSPVPIATSEPDDQTADPAEDDKDSEQPEPSKESSEPSEPAEESSEHSEPAEEAREQSDPETSQGTVPEPTTLPVARAVVDEVVVTEMPPTTAPDAPTTAMPPVDATILPVIPDADRNVPTEHSQDDDRSQDRDRRRGGILVAAAVALLLVGTGVGYAVMQNNDDTTSGADTTATSPSGSPSVSDTAPEPADGTELVASSQAAPEALQESLAMASRTTGVGVTALSEVDSFGTGDEERAAPAGGRLLAFTLGPWDCDQDSCKSWKKADLSVRVGSDKRPLPPGNGTYVVAVPQGTDKADLVLRADDTTQRLSLLRGKPASGNVAVLARAGEDRRTRIDRQLELTETASVCVQTQAGGPCFYPATLVAKVRGAELHYWFAGRQPKSTRRAFLVVDMFYTRPGDPQPQTWPREYVHLVVDGSDVEQHPAFIDGPAGEASPVFEVPAGFTKGTLVLGGPRVAPAQSGQTYTVTLSPGRVPVRFR